MNGTAEVFREAARLMAERGHCKGNLEDESGRVCLYGALQAATQDKSHWITPYFAACDLADDLILVFDPTFTTHHAPAWNDKPERTQTEVEKFLLWAADRIDVEVAGA